VLGSVGAFLVLESREHAEKRGRKPYARISAIASDRSRRGKGDVAAALTRLTKRMADEFGTAPLQVLSGACGVEPVTSEEHGFLESLANAGLVNAVRAYGSRVGHSVEAHFPLGVALAALALSQETFYPPFDDTELERPFSGAPERILVTGLGHWRGEGLAVLEQVG
jgi:3-oxoacyl-[acyl-carrier-protein] synthase II